MVSIDLSNLHYVMPSKCHFSFHLVIEKITIFKFEFKTIHRCGGKFNIVDMVMFRNALAATLSIYASMYRTYGLYSTSKERHVHNI